MAAGHPKPSFWDLKFVLRAVVAAAVSSAKDNNLKTKLWPCFVLSTDWLLTLWHGIATALKTVQMGASMTVATICDAAVGPKPGLFPFLIARLRSDPKFCLSNPSGLSIRPAQVVVSIVASGCGHRYA